MANNNGPEPTSIPEYFAGQRILITGGTGFMGKVLLEKILRCCPDVAMIYLMMRPKKHGSIDQRWKETMEIPLFDKLKSENPDALRKVIPVHGDIDLDNLGLSEETVDMLIENVTMVYHAAATIQFTNIFRDVLVKNTRATFLLLELAKRFKHLELFVYVSTAFSNMNIPCHQVEERVLPACQDWRVILQLHEREPQTMATIREKLMCGHPNIYTWSKSLSEQIVDEYKTHFPTLIMRPAVVCATWKEPMEGWADILCGMAAISIPLSLGIMRIIFTSRESYQDWIPADIAINACMVAPWKKYKTANRDVTDVYNCGVVDKVPVSTDDLITNGKEVVASHPSENLVWANHYICTTNETMFIILFMLLQFIPGIIMDLGLIIAGKKPRMLALSRKVSNISKLFRKFTTTQIQFPNDNFKELEKYVSPKDKVFSMNLEGLTALKLMNFGYKGALKYYFKEDVSEKTIQKNKKKLFWLTILDKIIVYTLKGVAIWILYRFLASIQLLNDFGSILYQGFYGMSI